MTDNIFKFWACLIFSQQDNCEHRPGAQDDSTLCWGDWLCEAFKNFPIPADFAGQINGRGEIIPERIDPIFRDEDAQPGDATLAAGTREALEQSRCLIVICSPRSARSLHVNEAVRYFKQLGRGSRIFSIVVAGEPNAAEGNLPGIPADNECFVPAMIHPVMPDGTLDTTRRERGYIFADARQADKREVRAADLLQAEAGLERAKIQLLAGVIGVGFNGLWQREQKRRFVGFAEAQRQSRLAQNQIQDALRQAREAQEQVQEMQHKAREAQQQAEDARNQARVAQLNVLEAQNQAREAQNQLEEAHKQAQEALKKFQEMQNQSRDLKSQIQEAQGKVLDDQTHASEAEKIVSEARNRAQEAQSQLEEARTQARQALDKVQEMQSQAGDLQKQVEAAQRQAEEARVQAREAQNKVLEAQSRVPAPPSLPAQNQSPDLESKIQEAQNQVLRIQNQAREAESKALDASNQAREARNQANEATKRAREAETKLLAAQNQSREAQSLMEQARNQAQASRKQAEIAQALIHESQTKAQAARRLTKIFALLAVLALLAAGTVAGFAWRQRKAANPTQAKAVSAEVRDADVSSGALDPEQVRQALQKIGGEEGNRQRRLDELAARIPAAQIPDALKAATAIVDDRQRSRFQLALLDNWLKTDLPGAFGWACQLPDADFRQRALEKIIPALPADNFTNTLARLNDLKPAPAEPVYAQLFQRWATNDPLQALQQRQQVPGHDAGDQIFCAIMAAWLDQQPDAALTWLKSQPDSDSKNRALETCIGEQAKSDVPKALTLAESLPAGTWRDTLIVGLFNDWAAKNLEAAATACQQLPDSEIKQQAWESVLSRRIAADPASAADQVKVLPPGDFRQKAISDLCRQWVAKDTPAVLAWAQSLTSTAEQGAAVNQVLAAWSLQDPSAALQFANQHPELSGEALAEIAGPLSQRDLSAATNWVATLPDGPKKDAVLLAVAGSVENRSPKLAAQYCTLLTASQPKPQLVQGIAQSLAADDLAAAVDWARSLTNDITRLTALNALSDSWAQSDPKAMATYSLALPAGDAQTRYLTAACRQLADRDLPATVDLLNQLSDAALRQTILEQAVRSCDLPHLNDAAKYIATMPAGDDQKAAVKGLLERWTPADPEAAANWLCSFPENNSQTDSLQPVIQTWSKSEPAAVAKWLSSSSAVTNSDVVTGAFLEGASKKYPEFAAQWTTSVADEARRQKFQIQVARQWLKTDPSSATNWISTLFLPEEIKRQLTTPAP